MKTLWIFAAVLLVVQLEECYGRFHRRDREFRDEKNSFRRPHLSSAEKFADSTPEHVIKVERESDGMLVGGFEGFGDDEKDIGNSRSFLNAEDNGRQGRGRSSRRRASYNTNDEYDSDRDYGYSEKSNRNNYNSRESRNHRSNNRNSGYGDNFDKNDNYGFDEKEDSFGGRKGNSNYDNGGYSNNDDTYYDNDDNQAYGSRGNKNSGHNSRGSRGNGNYGDYETNDNGYRNRRYESGQGYRSQRGYNGYGGSSHGRQGNYNRGRSQGNYNSPRRGLDGMSDVEAAQALYTGNPNAGNSKLDGLVNNKPVYLGEYNEKSDKQGKPRTEMGDYLYGENMVF